MSHSAILKEEVGVEEPCYGENPLSSDSQVLESRGEGSWGKVAGLTGRQVGDGSHVAPAPAAVFQSCLQRISTTLERDWRVWSQAFLVFFLFLLAICNICFLPWDLQLQSTPSLCTLKIYFYVGMLRYLVGVRWVVSGRGKREKAVGIFFFLTWNQFKAILFILGHITIIIIITNITLFFFYLRNWSSEVIINSSCKMFFTGGLRIHREFLLHFLI